METDGLWFTDTTPRCSHLWRPLPVFTIDCPECRGRECERCEGVGVLAFLDAWKCLSCGTVQATGR